MSIPRVLCVGLIAFGAPISAMAWRDIFFRHMDGQMAAACLLCAAFFGAIAACGVAGLWFSREQRT